MAPRPRQLLAQATVFNAPPFTPGPGQAPHSITSSLLTLRSNPGPMAACSSAGPDVEEQDATNMQRFVEGSKRGAQLLQDIDDLRKKQKEKRDEKKRLNKELKLAVRKRARLRTRARMLSNDDLFDVMALRNMTKKDRGESSTSQQSEACASAVNAEQAPAE